MTSLSHGWAHSAISAPAVDEKSAATRGSAKILSHLLPLFYKLLIQLKKRPSDIIGRNDRL